MEEDKVCLLRAEQSSQSRHFGLLSCSVENVQFLERANKCLPVFVVTVYDFS